MEKEYFGREAPGIGQANCRFHFMLHEFEGILFSDTAPSKRLQTLIPGYAKVRNGTTLAKDMGIDIILENCQHFREWVEMLKQI